MTIPSTIEEYTARFPDEPAEWTHVTGSRRFDYPIDYDVAILGVDEAAGRVEFLSRWSPNAYCHYHRHIGETAILVLEGEHHVVETRDNETIHKTRQPGFFAINPGGDVHMEYGGPEGVLVYFNCEADNGALFEVLDKDGTVLRTATVDDFTSGAIAARGSAAAG